jgi:hypothetical protein
MHLHKSNAAALSLPSFPHAGMDEDDLDVRNLNRMKSYTAGKAMAISHAPVQVGDDWRLAG